MSPSVLSEVAAVETERWAEAQTEKLRAATQWKREHALEFYRLVWACDDVQTLRALAHRLGYKEGT